jgi:hypothetical protein
MARWIRCVMSVTCAFTSGEKNLATKTCPSASPRSRSTHATHFFQRGRSSFTPSRNASWNSNAARWNGRDR